MTQGGPWLTNKHSHAHLLSEAIYRCRNMMTSKCGFEGGELQGHLEQHWRQGYIQADLPQDGLISFSQGTREECMDVTCSAS